MTPRILAMGLVKTYNEAHIERASYAPPQEGFCVCF